MEAGGSVKLRNSDDFDFTPLTQRQRGEDRQGLSDNPRQSEQMTRLAIVRSMRAARRGTLVSVLSLIVYAGRMMMVVMMMVVKIAVCVLVFAATVLSAVHAVGVRMPTRGQSQHKRPGG